MKRRAFLGAAAVAPIVGPGMAREAVASFADLSLGPLTGGAVGSGLAQSVGGPVSLGSSTDWAKEELARLVGKSAKRKLRERLGFPVQSLDPDIASLRSVSMSQKIRMQRDTSYERFEQNQQQHWLDIIDGIFD